jgi:CRP-like cAMP-binding protein
MPYGTTPVARQLEHGKSNRFLAALPPRDFSLLAPHLRTITLERGVMLHDVGEEIEHVYFPHTGMVSLVAVMQSGATVETATIGRGGVIGASAALGARWTFGRAVVQLPGAAAWLSAAQFHAAANECPAIRDLVVRYNVGRAGRLSRAALTGLFFCVLQLPLACQGKPNLRHVQ